MRHISIKHIKKKTEKFLKKKLTMQLLGSLMLQGRIQSACFSFDLGAQTDRGICLLSLNFNSNNQLHSIRQLKGFKIGFESRRAIVSAILIYYQWIPKK